MTLLEAPEQAPSVLEARGLTKHFAVHGDRGGRPPAATARDRARGRAGPGRARGRRRVAAADARARHRGGRRERLRQVHPCPDAGPAGHADLGRAAAWRGKPAPGGQRRRLRLRQDSPDGPAGPVRVAEPRARRALPPQQAVQGARPGEARGRPRRQDRRGARAGGADAGGRVLAQVPARAVRRASGSGWRSPGRSPCSRACCLPTSRSRCWTCPSGSACSTCSVTCGTVSTWRSCTSPTTSPRPGTWPTRSSSCTPGQVVESGPAVQVTDSPAHPYTQLLLSAAPDPERTTPVTLRGRGAPPSAVGAAVRLPVPYPRARTRWRSAPSRCRRPSRPAPAHVSACWLLDTDVPRRRPAGPDTDRPAADGDRPADWRGPA